MAARKDELKNVKVFMRTPTFDFGWYREDWDESFHVELSFVRPIAREMMLKHRSDFVPGG